MREIKRREVKRIGKFADAREKLDEAAEAKRLARELDVANNGSASKESAKYDDAFDSEFWVCLCFQTRAQKEEFLRQLGHDLMVSDKYVDGIELAKRIGARLSPAPKPITSKPKYLDLALERG